MNISLAKIPTETATATLLVVCHDGKKIKRGSALDHIDKQLGGRVSAMLKKEGFKGKVGESKSIHTHGKIPAESVLILGTEFEAKGDLAPNELEYIRRAGAFAVKKGNAQKARSLFFDLRSWPRGDSSEPEKIQALVEGMELAVYRFAVYLKNDPEKKSTLKDLVLGVQTRSKAAQRSVDVAQAIARGTNLARDLINTPASDMTPRELAKRAHKAAPAIRIKSYNKQEVARMKMGAFLAVARGSVEPPVFIHMTYKPKTRSKKTVAVIGKGVTFDSGGLSLKPPSSMETMKDDMSGAAAVIGLMESIAMIKPNVTVHGFIAATENMPSGHAVKPGDIARAMSGKTIEILNTDAEGRLTLADALQFAIRQKPDFVIDMATLTGACLVALGERCAGLMGNDEKLMDALQSAATKAGEMMWPLPLIEEYRSDLKSPIADIKNIGGRWGGTIEAGLFLQEFVDEGIKWAHLDIAGPSWANKPLPYCPKGGTGSMVSTLTHYILSL